MLLSRRVIAALLAVAVVWTVPAAAQSLADTGRFDEGLFWRIERPGVPPSYLYGTIHLGAPCEIYPRERVAERVRDARVVMLELVFDAPTIARLRAAARLPEDQRLVDLVGRAAFEKLAAIYGEAGVPRTHLDRLPIWAALTGLLTLLKPGTRAIDLEVADLARRSGRLLVALETVEEQVAFISSYLPDEQADAVRYAIDNHRRLGEIVDLMLQAWRVEDSGALLSMAEGRHAKVPAGGPGYQAHVRRKLAQSAERNRRMVDRAAAELERGNALIAVGALHLAGRDGMLALLVARGFTVRREDQGILQFPSQCSRAKLQ